MKSHEFDADSRLIKLCDLILFRKDINVIMQVVTVSSPVVVTSTQLVTR